MVLAIVWAILIFIGCSLPGKALPPIAVFDHFDKVLHFIFFFVFAFLWVASIEAPLKIQHFYFIVLVSFAYGFAIEFYQINFVEGRSWDVWDGIADGIGGCTGVLFMNKIR